MVWTVKIHGHNYLRVYCKVQERGIHDVDELMVMLRLKSNTHYVHHTCIMHYYFFYDVSIKIFKITSLSGISVSNG